MWLKESMHEKEYGEVLDERRQILNRVYDQGYQPLNQMYGRSKDKVGVSDDAEDGIEYPPMNIPGSRAPLPFISPLVPTDEGYPGLEPPVG